MSNDGILITNRFFMAVDLLKDNGRMQGGLKEFCERHDINRSWLSFVKNNAKKSPLRAEIIKWLCDDYGVSVDYLLWGKGSILKKTTTANK